MSGGNGAGPLPPHDITAEQAVLGAFLSGAALDDAGPRLRPADFYRPAHQMIYEAIRDLDGEGKPHDPVMVGDLLRRRRQTSTTGGSPYLHSCMAACPAAVWAGWYAEIIREDAVRRTVIEQADRLAQSAWDPGSDVDDHAAAACAEISAALCRAGRPASAEPAGRLP